MAIDTVAVVGAGTMGHGIAQVAAVAGCRVTLIDTTARLVEHGLQRIRDNLDGAVSRNKLDGAQRDAALDRITAALAIEQGAAGADLAIEAVPENLEIKAGVFRALDAAVRPDAILATNTSSLSVTDIQRATVRPGRVVGLHFFNPVHINRLVEVVRGRDTLDSVVESALAFVQRLDKESIVVRDAPGFATSRLGVLLGLEAMRMVEQGVASAEDIDKAMELGYRHPMGPLRLTDLVGLDVRLDIARYLHQKLGSDAFRPPAILERMVREGQLGKKTGRGFYDWTERGA
ncbi:MAG: 3-hydroxyacyl-CoA dehydrogenase family protein [Gemmatimonadetes bacterium]|nr:3-hydroxyacyl-CoA dehydrogenase family protein [Gemmatimonadota bacterium]